MAIPSPESAPQSPPSASNWRYGEHVAVVGDTGSGKTFLISRLVAARQYVVFLQTKSDETVAEQFRGFAERKQARSMDNLSESRIILRPRYDHQRSEIASALERAWTQGGWTMVVDELLYVEKLKLTWSVERLLTQGRSEKISVVIGMQRPVAVTRWGISQATHVFCFRVEGRDIATMAEATSPRIAGPLTRLREYEFVYFNRRSRQITTGTAQRLGETIVGANGIY